MRYYAICDCDNCYVSCERVFRPDLQGKPVVVLSNNDGCVVARSAEAKQMGIKAGTPYYQLAQLFPGQDITVFSSNYELYGEITGRIMAIIKDMAPWYFRYSIDEAFCVLDDFTPTELKQWGKDLHDRVQQSVGMPVSIGIAPTKTLAKMASHFAKKYAGYEHCCLIDTDEKREKALALYPIDDVWGIGRRYAAKLDRMGIKKALDFANHHQDWVRNVFKNIVIERTWRELQGDDCVPNEEMAKKKSICTSRSFDGMISNYDMLKTHVVNFAVKCAEKVRRQDSVASIVGVFIDTNHFRDDLPQYWNMADTQLLTPSSSTLEIIKAVTHCLKSIYRPGYCYKRAGVMMMGIISRNAIQPDLFTFDPAKHQKFSELDTAVDKINKVEGSETIIVAAQQYPGGKKFSDAIKHDFKSKNPTTRWSDIIELK